MMKGTIAGVFRLLLWSSALVGAYGCGSDESPAAASTGTDAGAGGSNGGSPSAGGSPSTGGASNAGSGGASNPGSGGSAQSGAGGMMPMPPPPRDPCVAAGTCPPGVWINVTPSGMDAADLRPSTNAFGPGSIVGDPARPSDLYVGGSKSGLWKSTDYGNTWSLVNDTLPDVPRGVTIAVAGTDPATVWASAYRIIYKSIDTGKTFATFDLSEDLYSLTVDPNDDNHLISGLHEADGIMESTNGGETWNRVGTSGFPSGGKSWYPFFIDAGDVAKTRVTWLAIAQDGGSVCITRDAGATWTIPSGVNGLGHPHGNAQIYQNGSSIFVGGVGGPGQGVYRSTDLGASFARVDSGDMPEAIVWGTSKNVYAMYAWACSGCDLGTNFEIASQPGDSWTKTGVPSELTIGPNSLVVTSDGTHDIFVALMWDQGIWRYIEP
jgi:photosystem II stability/assembly factor-like uncharacterized protein